MSSVAVVSTEHEAAEGSHMACSAVSASRQHSIWGCSTLGPRGHKASVQSMRRFVPVWYEVCHAEQLDQCRTPGQGCAAQPSCSKTTLLHYDHMARLAAEMPSTCLSQLLLTCVPELVNGGKHCASDLPRTLTAAVLRQ